MSGSTTDAVTRNARKPHRCSWCWEWIAKGEAHQTYTQFGDGKATTVRLHPECYDAMLDCASAEGGWAEWTPGMERPERIAMEEQKS